MWDAVKLKNWETNSEICARVFIYNCADNVVGVGLGAKVTGGTLGTIKAGCVVNSSIARRYTEQGSEKYDGKGTLGTGGDRKKLFLWWLNGLRYNANYKTYYQATRWS